MKQQPPPLLPLLRSNLQGMMLARLLLEPDRSYGVRELSKLVGGSLSSVHLELERLESAELIRSRQAGRTRLVSANTEHELYRPMYDLILRTYGPREKAESVLEGVDGIEEAYIFGSWARRFESEPGPMPRDLDVVLVGPVSRSDVRAISTRLESDLGMEVGVTSFTRREWDAAASGFLQTVKSGPLIDIRRSADRDVADR